MTRRIVLPFILIAAGTAAQTPHKAPEALRAEAKALLVTETALSKKDICQNPDFKQMDLNTCFGNEAARIDKGYVCLVRILGALLREEAKDDRSADAPPSIAPKTFDSAEYSWQNYRKSTCTAVAFQYQAGSMQPMQFAGCYANLTFNHMKEIVPLYADEP